MICVKCGHEIPEGAAFCPDCGEKAAQDDSSPEMPLYQTNVKTLLKSGRLVVYQDRTEFVTSSVQKNTYYYNGLVSVKKNLVGNGIDFITEDGRTETCPADRKCVHEAFVHIEQASKVYLSQRKERLLSQGVRYSFPSRQGLLNGVLNLSDKQAEFKPKSGKNDIVSYRDVKSVTVYTGTLNFILFGGETKSYAVSKELRDEVLAFVTDSIAPYLAQRKEDLQAQGIYFSSYEPDGRTLDIRADRIEYKGRSGQVVVCIPFQDVRTAYLNEGMLELALTDGTSRAFLVEADVVAEILAFVKKAIEPYVASRTVGFDATFGIDEQIEFNDKRGVFHLIRQGGKEITNEWPTKDLIRCKWTEDKKLTTLGSVVSGSIDLIKNAAKAVGSQTGTETEEKIGSVDVILTIRTGQAAQSQSVCFGRSSVGMGRTDKKYSQCLAAWDELLKYMKTCCPECELIKSVVPEPESGSLARMGSENVESANAAIGQRSAPAGPDAATRGDELEVADFIKAVSQFINDCSTPMTIAFQGNRGSGKSSILRMLFDQMEEQYGKNLLWLNARQLHQSESGESLSFQVGKKLTGQLMNESTAVKQKGTLLTGLASLATGVIVKDTSLGKEIASGVLDKNPAYPQENPLAFFSRQIKAKAQSKNGRVIFFIDGLDQLAPARAVELLEAMRDFFECKGCVFVVSADRKHILHGARECYGEDKAKHFFNEMFKMTFQVPASGLNVKGYVKGKLETMDIRAEDNEDLELYTALIQNSVGKDTAAIDRLFTSYQLLLKMAGRERRYKRLVLFALLCMQTRFQDTYDYIMQRRASVTPEFLAGLCGESAQPWDTVQADDEIAAYRAFSNVFAQIINPDGKAAISESECQAFAEVLELSSVTSR